MSAPELIYKQNCARFASSLPLQSGERRWRRGRGCAWQDWVYLLHLAESRGGSGTAQVPSIPSPSPSFPYLQCYRHPRGLPSPSPSPDSGRSPPVVWGWRRRDGQGAPQYRVLPHPALTQGEGGGGEGGGGRHLCPKGENGGELQILNSSGHQRL